MGFDKVFLENGGESGYLRGTHFMSACEAIVVKKVFVDISEAAVIAGCSVKRFRSIAEVKRIPIVQLGQKFFVLRSHFEQLPKTK